MRHFCYPKKKSQRSLDVKTHWTDLIVIWNPIVREITCSDWLGLSLLPTSKPIPMARANSGPWLAVSESQAIQVARSEVSLSEPLGLSVLSFWKVPSSQIKKKKKNIKLPAPRSLPCALLVTLPQTWGNPYFFFCHHRFINSASVCFFVQLESWAHIFFLWAASFAQLYVCESHWYCCVDS